MQMHVLCQTNNEGSLKLMYIQTSVMHTFVVNFPEVLLLDATCRTNKIKMPLFVSMVVDGFGISQIVAYCFVANKHQHIVTDSEDIR